MKIIQTTEKTISGISIRTTNANEMNPATAKIGAVHQRFDEVVSVDYKSGSRAYGVYFDYESDAMGEFSVMSGADGYESASEELEEITLPAGKYLVFEGNGEMPQAIINTWQEIWAYFSDSASEERSYSVDYEFYKSQNEFEIYISIRDLCMKSYFLS